jgi:hypothetical protein
MGNVLTMRYRSDVSEPIPVSVIWEDDDGQPWRVVVDWRVQHGAPVPVGFSVRAWESDPESPTGMPRNVESAPRSGRVLPWAAANQELPAVGSAMMRGLPVGALLRESLERLADALESPAPGEDAPAEWVEAHAQWRAATREARQAVREGPDNPRRLGDEHYRRVADIYRDAVRNGEPPTAAVADALTVSKSAAAKQVARARERGLLPRTSRGRVGNLREEL